MPSKYNPFEGTGIEDLPNRPPEPLGGVSQESHPNLTLGGIPPTYIRTVADELKNKPHIHVWVETEVGCEDCGTHPGLRCDADDECEYSEAIDLSRYDDPRIHYARTGDRFIHAHFLAEDSVVAAIRKNGPRDEDYQVRVVTSVSRYVGGATVFHIDEKSWNEGRRRGDSKFPLSRESEFVSRWLPEPDEE